MVGHLTAGQSKLNERLKDLIDIQNNVRFAGGKNLKMFCFFAFFFKQANLRSVHHTPTVQSHDYQFLLGDLNFRIDLPYVEAVQRANAMDLAHLLNYDQVCKSNNKQPTSNIQRPTTRPTANNQPTQQPLANTKKHTKRTKERCSF